jgi:hypothetical protein
VAELRLFPVGEDAPPPGPPGQRQASAAAHAQVGDPTDYGLPILDYFHRLAALYSHGLEPQDRNPARAVDLARAAVALAPEDYRSWASLGWGAVPQRGLEGQLRAIGARVRAEAGR